MASVIISNCDNTQLKRKLACYGLFPKKLLTVLNRFSNGSVVIGNDNFKFAIDSNLASEIFVSVVNR